MANGKKIYCLHNLAVIGCASRTPAATSYYDDSCRLIARFPDNFFIKQLRRPFLAVGYNPNDFPESLSGDYPAYFANLPDSFTNSANGVQASGSSENQFRKKRVFTIGQIYDSTIIFQNGDVIIISTQEGLSHYRNKKLLHTYKIIPGLRTQLYQLQNRVAASSKIEKRKIIYYMGGIKKYIDISAGQLLVSVADYEDPLRSSDNKVVLMEVVCEVSPKS
ncbi:MAG: hypothetical protein ABIN36_11460 [Ferruginibacter sp.]